MAVLFGFLARNAAGADSDLDLAVGADRPLDADDKPYYQIMSFAEGDYPEAERYYRKAISLPLFSGLAEAEQDFMVEQLRAILEWGCPPDGIEQR